MFCCLEILTKRQKGRGPLPDAGELVLIYPNKSITSYIPLDTCGSQATHYAFITWIVNFIKIKSHNGKGVQSQPRVCFGSFHKPHETRPTGSLSDQLCRCAWKSTETVLWKEGLLNTHYYCFNWLPLHSTPTAFHLDFNAENTLKM